MAIVAPDWRCPVERMRISRQECCDKKPHTSEKARRSLHQCLKKLSAACNTCLKLSEKCSRTLENRSSKRRIAIYRIHFGILNRGRVVSDDPAKGGRESPVEGRKYEADAIHELL